MYESFSILRFRGLNRCNIKGMQRVTLITGKNNAGKTAVLESMFIHAGSHNPNLLIVVNALRGLNKFRVDPSPGSDSPWISVFAGYDDTQPIKLVGEVRTKPGHTETKTMQISPVRNHTELSGMSSAARNLPVTNEGLSSKVLKLEFSEGRKAKSSKNFLYFDGTQQVIFPQPPLVKYQARIVSPRHKETAEDQANLLAKFQIHGHMPQLLDAIRVIEPRLKSLELVFNGEPTLHGDIGLAERRLIPLAIMGDGVTRVASLVMSIGTSPGGVVFIDDIDTGIHHSVMEKLWVAIFRAAETFDVQVVATTHSEECLKSAMAAATEEGKKAELSLIRLERQGDEVKSFTYDADDIEIAFSSGLEVR